MRLLVRPLRTTVSLAVVLVASGLVGPTGHAVPPGSDRTPASGLRLRLVDEAGMRAGTRALPEGTTRLRTSAYSLVAVTWRGGPAPQVTVSAKVAGTWQPWQPLEPLGDLGESTGVHGTEPWWVGAGRGVRVRIAGGARGARLVLIDPGPDPVGMPRAAERDRPATPARAAARPRRGPRYASRPELHSRESWGAREAWRSGRPRYNTTLKQVHLHHTATSNDYRRGDVRGILRAIYRYHTKNLGWSDIGYNFLVDRFGRAWVGRAGGPGRLVRGAHTLGFNNTSTGIAVIGNFEEESPPEAVVSRLVHLAAWKLDRYDRDPRGDVSVLSHGSDLFARRERVVLPAIDGHRDTNATACPGQLLYDLLPEIRERTGRRVDRFS